MGDKRSILRLLVIFALIGGVLFFLQELNLWLSIYPALPIPGGEPDKYDRFFATHWPTVCQVPILIVYLATALFNIPVGLLLLLVKVPMAYYGWLVTLQVVLGYLFSAFVWAGVAFGIGKFIDWIKGAVKR